MKQYRPAVHLVCPTCHGELQFDESIGCRRCGAQYTFEHGVPDLIVGGRFDDEDNAERTSYENLTNTYLTENYLIPTFEKLFPQPRRKRVLSLGCGVGIDVDLLANRGFDIVGIDCGNRSVDWHRRSCRDRLYLANGKHLPFETETFDLVYCGCVFPHIGVQGDSNRVSPTFWADRLAVASEMTRVLKRNGRIMVSSPNRWFPLDLFHGRDGGKLVPRFNPPSSPFLLSAGDYARLFGEAGCTGFRPLPVTGYWGFLRMKQRTAGKLMAFPIDTIFRTVSAPGLSFLRTTPLNPWLIMLMHKEAGQRARVHGAA